MKRDEEHGVGTSDSVAKLLGKAAKIVGHTGSPELFVGSGNKMAVVKDLAVFCVLATAHTVGRIHMLSGNRRVLVTSTVRQLGRVVAAVGC